jgi:hypothetical protein
MGKSSKGDAPDYSHLFKDEQPANSAVDTAARAFRSAGQRVRAFIFGLVFSVMALGFSIFGLGIAAREIQQYYAWPCGQAKVVSVAATEPQEDAENPGVAISYTFAAEGRQHSGEFTMAENHVGFDAVAAIQEGQSVEIHYPPGRPDLSSLRLPPVVVTIGFALFVIPFLLFGIASFIGAVRGQPISVSGKAGAEDITRGRFTAFWLLCCLGAFACMFLTGFLFDWIIDLLIFVLYGAVVIPVSMKRITTWLQRRQELKKAKQEAAKRNFEANFIDDAAPEEDTASENTDGLIAPLPTFREADLPDLPSPLKQLRNAILITLFVWAVVGTFLGFFVYPIYKARQAIHFHQTDGTVIASRVKTATTRSDGRTSTSHTPIIEYRYTVDGREYVNDDYTFVYMEANESGQAGKIVSDHPEGKAVTVYYNPDAPQEAVLDRNINPISWFLMLFLQPFLLVAVGLLVWLPVVPVRNRRLRDFLFSPTVLPQPIPFWGSLQPSIEGLTVKKTGRLASLVHASCTGYALTVLVSVFVAAFYIGVENVTPLHLQKVATYGLLVAAGFAFLTLLKRHSRVTFDTSMHCLRVRSTKRDETIAFDDITCWQGRMFTTGSEKNGKQFTYLIEAVSTDGETTVPVHLFAFNTNALASEDMRRAVVRRTLHTFAEITHSRVQTRLVVASPPFSPDTQPKDVADLAGLVHKAARHARQYSDLS